MSKWKPGQSGNPKGRPVGSKNESYRQLMDAIKKVEKKKGKNLLLHFVERAFENDKVLATAIAKFIPDMKHVTSENLHEIQGSLVDAANQVLREREKKKK